MEEYERFRGLKWFSPQEVFIGGAGGIGSWLTLFLQRAGFTVTVMDFDTVNVSNLGGQLFYYTSCGRLKVTALEHVVRDLTGRTLTTVTEKFTEDSPTTPYMFSAFDNMKARKDMFDVWKKSFNAYNKPIFIDGRLSAEFFQIFCVTESTVDMYEKYLFHDTEVEDISCTVKQTSHVAAMIAAMMTGFFTNHIENVVQSTPHRTIPFYTEYSVPLNLFKSEDTCKELS